MEPAQARPPRKRRRWLIVASLLVLTGVSWWSWSRGDSRLIGRWHTAEGELGFDFLRFRRNGRFETGTVESERRLIGCYRADGETLVFGNEFGASLSPFLFPVCQWWGDKTGQYYVPFSEERRSTITFDGPDAVDLRDENYGQPARYHRIPE
jgi:hypothetical protein